MKYELNKQKYWGKLSKMMEMKNITHQIKKTVASLIYRMDQEKNRLTQLEDKVDKLEQSNKDKNKLIRYQEESKMDMTLWKGQIYR